MVYNSEIQFTLDTICPWTYLSLRRLSRALARLPADCPVVFTLVFKPYQLYPTTPLEGQDKRAWYRTTRYGDSPEKLRTYETLMAAYGVAEGITFSFDGIIANTLPAHRVIQHFQEKRGAETAERLVGSLYRQYFEEERHPSSAETLVKAAVEAVVGEDEARAVVEDESEGLTEVKSMIREQAGNGVDAVPYVVIEGKRRDITLVGCKEVEEYVKALNSIIKESQ